MSLKEEFRIADIELVDKQIERKEEEIEWQKTQIQRLKERRSWLESK